MGGGWDALSRRGRLGGRAGTRARVTTTSLSGAVSRGEDWQIVWTWDLQVSKATGEPCAVRRLISRSAGGGLEEASNRGRRGSVLGVPVLAGRLGLHV
jgi:hypothetical protein